MVFDEKVLTALEVLTDAAENDFELFRICSLVRDLVSPPQVEVIDETHQQFNGVKYYKNKDSHYVTANGIQRDCWRYYNGDIPEGYEIHHDDWNPANNDISNLQLLTKAEHRKKHNDVTLKRRIFVCESCGVEFETYDNGRNRFCSQQCLENFRQAHPSERRVCLYCGNEFYALPKDHRKYCSRTCAANAITGN